MNLIEISRMSENEAREYVESIRWPQGPVCPHCGDKKRAYPLKGKATRSGVYKCGACRKQFTVTVGTVLHRSHISLRQWIIAFHLMCSSKKGVSALQLQREMGLKSYQAAWFLAHRIRAAMKEDPLASLLDGTVEADETYIGGKGKPGSKRGRGTSKMPVVALISRKGRAYSKPVERVNAKELKGAIRKMVSKDSRIITDEWKAYQGIGREFAGGHESVNHGEKEYARGDVHVNNAESYFALLKRGVHGIFHHVSREHLGRYCDEFSFRWNHRKVSDGERTIAAIRGIAGKRLAYQASR
ncbi:MAG: IS1595 family transposase [bacterium]|nr:IS1595 family transposase [bacterium]